MIKKLQIFCIILFISVTKLFATSYDGLFDVKINDWYFSIQWRLDADLDYLTEKTTYYKILSLINNNYELFENLTDSLVFDIKSPDSYLRLPHSVVYKYDQYGNLIIESKCSDENFTGLNFCNVYKLKGNFISTGKIQIKYFEKQSKKYDLNFNYETNTITVLGESIHSYFTDIINYIYETL